MKQLELAKYIHTEVRGYCQWPEPDCTQCMQVAKEIMDLLDKEDTWNPIQTHSKPH